MFRTNDPTAAPGNLYTEGNPAVPTPATKVRAKNMNTFQEEICNVIEPEGIVLNEANNAQLRAAIISMISRMGGGMRYLNPTLAAALTGPVEPGMYELDSHLGAFGFQVIAAPTTPSAYIFIDPRNSWRSNRVTIDLNGHTVKGRVGPALAGPLILDVSNQMFIFYFDAVDNTWRFA
ncbi:MAG: hypothetical protein HYX47_10180 [Burkholderiales bacterium]|nr:hypothetical protein [Burkholderiales bacterium]